ncbi:MAG: PEP/pyruvate-binding domain-containing protein [Pseudomonadota bacterium]
MSDYVLWFQDATCLDVGQSGGKGASLANMTQQGLPVPGGFAIPAVVLEHCVDVDALRGFARAQDHEAAVKLVEETAQVPEDVLDAYAQMGGGKVAVRSSACAEDSEAASYAGQQETYLNVEGKEAVRKAVIDCWASFFSERAIFYRGEKGSLDDLRMAVVVQKMVDADKAGVAFSNHPITRRKDRMMIEAVRGLGEAVVSGEVTPDQYVVDRRGREKKSQTPHGGVLSADELAQISALAVQLEDQHGKPQDIEWAIYQSDVYLLQSRPITA